MLTVITFRPESLLLIMRVIVVMAIRPYRSTFNLMLLAFWDMWTFDYLTFKFACFAFLVELLFFC
jgi:hypothetical protein